MQTDATLLDVIYCVRLHTQLHFVECCGAKFGPTILGVVGPTMLRAVGLTMLRVVSSVYTWLKNLFRLTWKNATSYSQVCFSVSDFLKDKLRVFVYFGHT